MPYLTSAQQGHGYVIERSARRPSRVRRSRRPRTHLENVSGAVGSTLLTAAHFVPGGALVAMALAPKPAQRQRTLRGPGSSLVTTGVASAGTAGASAAATAGLTAAGVTAGGALIGTVVPIVGSLVGAVIGALLSGHFARAAGAKNENAAVAQILPAIKTDIINIFNSANAGQISATDAITAMQQVQQNYWQAIAQYQTQPGTSNKTPCTQQSDTPGNATKCDKNCTVGCCIGCNVVNEWVYDSIRAFQIGSGAGPLPWNTAKGNKYGLPTIGPPSVKYTPPAGVTGGISSALSSTVAGVPIWALGGAAAIALYFLM